MVSMTTRQGVVDPAQIASGTSSPQTAVERWTTILLLAASCLLTWHFLTAAFDSVLGTFEDDSFYYLTVARNIATGHGSTFDGIHPTNGYHPLWCALLVPLAGFFKASPEATVRAVAVLCVWLRFVAAWLVLRLTVRAFTNTTVAAVAAFVYLVAANGFSTNGMEEALQMLALLLLLTVVAGNAFERGTSRDGLIRGVLVAFVVLSRLDMVLFAGIYFLLRAVAVWRAKISFRQVASEAATFTVLLAGYLGWNAAHFDTVMPISGMLKSSFPHIALPSYFWIYATPGHRLLVLHAIVVAVFLTVAGRVTFIASLTGWKDRGAVDALRLWAWSMMAFLGYQLVFVKWGNALSWYYQPFALLGAVGVAQWLQSGTRLLQVVPVVRHAARPALAVAAAFTILVAAGALVKRHRTAGEDFHIASYHAAEWVASHTPPDTIMAMKDSGAFGFFSNRHVINLDGVVNDRDFQRALIDQGITAYLTREHVALLAQHSLRRSSEAVREGHYGVFPLEYRAMLFDRPGGALQLHCTDEIYRLPWTSAEYGQNVFVIWRVDPATEVGRADAPLDRGCASGSDQPVEP
jgi:hypothetical protein